jgi:hypothetical protein
VNTCGLGWGGIGGVTGNKGRRLAGSLKVIFTTVEHKYSTFDRFEHLIYRLIIYLVKGALKSLENRIRCSFWLWLTRMRIRASYGQGCCVLAF